VKSDIRTWLACADFRKVLDAARSHNRTISTLITLTYSDDPLIRWRAIDAIGRCAEDLSADRPEIFRNYLRRLFWMMSDEAGAVAPHAPEAIGEIIHSNPEEFLEFIPLTISLLNLEPEDRPLFLPGILYALGLIGEAVPGSVEGGLEDIEKSLLDPDSQVRAMAVRCLDRIQAYAVLLRYPELARDDGRSQIYFKEQILSTTVDRIYSEAFMRAGIQDSEFK
jgi:hypothetical protein